MEIVKTVEKLVQVIQSDSIDNDVMRDYQKLYLRDGTTLVPEDSVDSFNAFLKAILVFGTLLRTGDRRTAMSLPAVEEIPTFGPSWLVDTPELVRLLPYLEKSNTFVSSPLNEYVLNKNLMILLDGEKHSTKRLEFERLVVEATSRLEKHKFADDISWDDYEQHVIQTIFNLFFEITLSDVELFMFTLISRKLVILTYFSEEQLSWIGLWALLPLYYQIRMYFAVRVSEAMGKPKDKCLEWIDAISVAGVNGVCTLLGNAKAYLEETGVDMYHDNPSAYIFEVVRTNPPVMGSFHKCTKDIDVEHRGKKYKLLKGAKVQWTPFFNIYDSKWGETPKQFDATRSNLTTDTSVGWKEGSRMCPCKDLSLVIAREILDRLTSAEKTGTKGYRAVQRPTSCPFSRSPK